VTYWGVPNADEAVAPLYQGGGNARSAVQEVVEGISVATGRDRSAT